MCDQDPLLLENIVTGDEAWCYQLDPAKDGVVFTDFSATKKE